VTAPVSLVDVAPTALALLGIKPFDVDGIDLSPAIKGAVLPDRDLYAESFAPLLDFGWSPLRSIRSAGYKLIDAPVPELYDTKTDPDETKDLSTSDRTRAADFKTRVQRYSTTTVDTRALDSEARSRLQALGYVSGGSDRPGPKPDPKDRRELAAQIAQVTSGELQGAALEVALRKILAEDPKNPLANLRMGYVLAQSNRCAQAVPFFNAAIAARMPNADAHLGLAGCQATAGRAAEAIATLRAAEAVEPGNPVVLANEGILLSDTGNHRGGSQALQKALAIDPDFHEARFNLARVFARAGDRSDAVRAAEELLRRLPPNAPQRPEVERLLKAVQ
jgi:tetratricopeptide (TPR) repeat protein